jgi:tetratricopeptide (TPR) repeat protein
MAKLNAAFERTNFSQRRFVIYGLGGSGKTELALKYAEEHQDKFWGVFFVDGSSRKNASGSYAEIATIGGVEPNERSAKNWLMTRDLPWLLILDNVDDDEVSLDDLLPAGTKGCILITSRNPSHKNYGNVGNRFLELQIMEKEEANELILKAAEAPSPWPISVKESASTICQALGYLPLALVHAAKAILLGLCSWGGYLTYYERQTQRIRRERFRRRSKSPSQKRTGFKEDSDNMNIFSSYEILHQSLEASSEERFQDAAELLHVFSYLHFQNIRLDFLLSAAINPFKEADQREKEAREEASLQKKLLKPKPKSWSIWLRELTLVLKGYLDTPPPLPAALKNPEKLPQSVFEDEVHVRLSEALAVLIKRSLVMKQDRVESRYSMHPLVHQWVRERPDTGISQQSLWCQVAMTTLAKSILRPPLGDADNERKMRRELLPHIIHVRECQVVIKKRMEENRTLVKPLWPAPNDKLGRLQADESARFSRVYSECGLFNEALQLQYRTLTFLTQMLGENHPLTIRVTLFVSGTLWELTRVAEATQLQRRALQVCVESLGEDNPLTLEVAELLGSALALKGRWAEALAIHENNVEKMRSLYGGDHEKTLTSIRNVARLHYRYMEYEKATELHQVVWEGMKRRLAETHLETLTSLEDLAMSYLRHYAEPADQVSQEQLFESHERIKFVLEQRKKILGKEQPYTLLASLYLAQLKSALGQHREAERMIREGLPIAERNLGEEHTAVLAAKASCARLFIHIGRCDDAEEILRALIRKPKYREMSDEDGDHPDRIAALWFLTECLEKQGRFPEALEMAKEVVDAMQKIGGQGLGSKHKFAVRAQGKIVELRRRVPDGA